MDSNAIPDIELSRELQLAASNLRLAKSVGQVHVVVVTHLKQLDIHDRIDLWTRYRGGHVALRIFSTQEPHPEPDFALKGANPRLEKALERRGNQGFASEPDKGGFYSRYVHLETETLQDYPQAALIVASPGSGKSRLALEAAAVFGRELLKRCLILGDRERFSDYQGFELYSDLRGVIEPLLLTQRVAKPALEVPVTTEGLCRVMEENWDSLTNKKEIISVFKALAKDKKRSAVVSDFLNLLQSTADGRRVAEHVLMATGEAMFDPALRASAKHQHPLNGTKLNELTKGTTDSIRAQVKNQSEEHGEVHASSISDSSNGEVKHKDAVPTPTGSEAVKLMLIQSNPTGRALIDQPEPEPEYTNPASTPDLQRKLQDIYWKLMNGADLGEIKLELTTTLCGFAPSGALFLWVEGCDHKNGNYLIACVNDKSQSEKPICFRSSLTGLDPLGFTGVKYVLDKKRSIEYSISGTNVLNYDEFRRPIERNDINVNRDQWKYKVYLPLRLSLLGFKDSNAYASLHLSKDYDFSPNDLAEAMRVLGFFADMCLAQIS